MDHLAHAQPCRVGHRKEDAVLQTAYSVEETAHLLPRESPEVGQAVWVAGYTTAQLPR